MFDQSDFLFLALAAVVVAVVVVGCAPISVEEPNAQRMVEKWGSFNERAVRRVYGPDADGVACYASGTDARSMSCVTLPKGGDQ